MSKVISFTGQRPKDMLGYKDNYDPMRRYLESIVSYFYDYFDVKTFITGGAQGIDQLAFWAVQNVKKQHPDIQNHVYLPCKNIDSRWMDTGLFSKQEFSLILKKADKVLYVSEEEYQSNEQYLNRDAKMVSDADIVIGVLGAGLDFTTHLKSGTAATMRYAKQHNKEIYQVSFSVSNREFTDITTKQVYKPNDFIVTLQDKVFTGYFALTDQYKENGLNICSIARVTPAQILCNRLPLFAPPQDLLSDYKNAGLSDEDYKKRYLDHLDKIDVKSELIKMSEWLGENGIVLLCYEAPPEFCHRNLLAEYLNEKYALNIREFDAKTLTDNKEQGEITLE